LLAKAIYFSFVVCDLTDRIVKKSSANREQINRLKNSKKRRDFCTSYIYYRLAAFTQTHKLSYLFESKQNTYINIRLRRYFANYATIKAGGRAIILHEQQWRRGTICKQ
jgi:hypothetical protein